MNNKELRRERPEPFYRIQRRDEYEKIITHEKYRNAGQIEVRFFDIYIHNLLNKFGAESRTMQCFHMEDFNKGYPKDYKEYMTYDDRREKNFKGNG